MNSSYTTFLLKSLCFLLVLHYSLAAAILRERDTLAGSYNRTELQALLDPKYKADILNSQENVLINTVSNKLFGPHTEKNAEIYYQTRFMLTQITNKLDRLIDCYSKLLNSTTTYENATESTGLSQNISTNLTKAATKRDSDSSTESLPDQINQCLWKIEEKEAKELSSTFTQLSSAFKKMKQNKGMCLGENFGMCTGENVAAAEDIKVDSPEQTTVAPTSTSVESDRLLALQTSSSSNQIDSASNLSLPLREPNVVSINEARKILLTNLESKSKLIVTTKPDMSLKDAINLSAWVNAVRNALAPDSPQQTATADLET